MASISVIIPTYNRAQSLPRALNSVIRQSHPVDEIIVVDDGSTDNTREMITHHYPGVMLIQQDNHGVSYARNRGIEKAKGDWIALLDSDDEWLEHKLERQIAVINDNPEDMLIHTNEIWMRNGERVNQMEKHRKSGGHIFQKCLPLCVISPSSCLVHHCLFEEIGLFDESLPACEDYDLWLRICADHAVYYIDEPLIVKHGGHRDQLSKKHWGMDRFRIQALSRIIKKHSLSEENRQAAIKIMKDKIEIYISGATKHNNQAHVQEFCQLLEHYS